MKFVYVFLLVTFIAYTNIFGQTNFTQQLSQLSALEQRGRFSEVIEPASRLIDSNTLSQGELGRAILLLGVAYQQSGDYMHAQSSYERAMHILSTNQTYAEDYVATLDNLARLYLEMGQTETAVSVEKKALSTCERLEDHGGTARSLATLAGLEINQNHRRRGEEYLSR